MPPDVVRGLVVRDPELDVGEVAADAGLSSDSSSIFCPVNIGTELVCTIKCVFYKHHYIVIILSQKQIPLLTAW